MPLRGILAWTNGMAGTLGPPPPVLRPPVLKEGRFLQLQMAVKKTNRDRGPKMTHGQWWVLSSHMSVCMQSLYPGKFWMLFYFICPFKKQLTCKWKMFFLPKLIAFASLVHSLEFFNLIARALRSWIYYPNATSLIIKVELCQTNERYVWSSSLCFPHLASLSRAKYLSPTGACDSFVRKVCGVSCGNEESWHWKQWHNWVINIH